VDDEISLGDLRKLNESTDPGVLLTVLAGLLNGVSLTDEGELMSNAAS